MNADQVRWLITDHNVTVNFKGQTHIVPRSDNMADRLITAIKAQDWKKVPTLVSAAKRIEKFSKGTFQVRDGQILVNGVVAPTALGQKILRFSNDGLPYQPLVKFAEKLQQNPSFRAVNELFTFLEKNDHPITETGNFIAYKRVRGDFMDIHSGTFDNHPGQAPTVNRNQVDEDCSRTCSEGLHVANWNYAHTQFASSNSATDVMLEVEVNPADVVAVPVDYNNSKMRVCKYVVLNVVDEENSTSALRVTGSNYDVQDDLDDEDENEDEDLGCCSGCGDYLDDCCDTLDEICCTCQEERDPYNDDEDDDEGCESCGEVDCFGECDDEEDDDYPFEEELR